ncbi:PEP/pyruvate-binding domain-containing protein [Chrysiogenes arsenatis]|uniref:PEP/pyruvate-binding domain-containing protein n=1 Tax=Chrysiogenes arsenatis TaxID=309797 RepID=UPI0004006976|nr:PEP/pyruvate-binding domain-containing protein [Chrysiogenes arsenatis]
MSYAKREKISTGLSGLDAILDSLRLGDNVVWKVDSLESYQRVVTPFVHQALAEKRRVVYLRFGAHHPVIDPALAGVEVVDLNPRLGFEPFASTVHRILSTRGRGVMYVFDCLSDLVSAWATDYMVANFFQITCPYLLSLDTVAYFSLRNQHHSLETIQRIRKTTQLFLSFYRHEDHYYVHPLKVYARNSPTMFLPHREEDEKFVPMARSYEATALMSSFMPREGGAIVRQLDHWQRLFLQAEELFASGASPREQKDMVRHLCRHLMGKDERVLQLAETYFSLTDLLEIKRRMVGTGYIGGKSTGMLLARRILHATEPEYWEDVLEPHDSYYIGSNLYYWYLIHNDCWNLFMEHKESEQHGSFAAQQLRSRILHGHFPSAIRQEFENMLDYYGQYPIIVRSSSLLEDGFGNAFAGKYDSFFLANQEITPEERLEHFEDIVRRIFVSTIGKDALVYRRQRGLAEQDEQMGLLVQRVIGSYRNHYYFPDVAGVGISYNTFVWDSSMDPHAGMLRLVVGLGTRAVDRAEGDYARIVALDHPRKKPYHDGDDTRRFAQKDVDVLDLNANTLTTIPLNSLMGEDIERVLARVALHERREITHRGKLSRTHISWIPTFDILFEQTDFAERMQKLLQTLDRVYDYPVDIEFTLNFRDDGSYCLNIVQCRPLQTRKIGQKVEIPDDIVEEHIILKQHGGFVGGSLIQPIRRIILVNAPGYHELSLAGKHEVAKIIGEINMNTDRTEEPTLLIGPGRWGTSTPALGVPVNFAEINNMSVLAEVGWSRGGFVPELSFGTHFFQDLVENEIFYIAIFPDRAGVLLREEWFQALPNDLEGLVPRARGYENVIKVSSLSKELCLRADVLSQQILCFVNE